MLKITGLFTSFWGEFLENVLRCYNKCGINMAFTIYNKKILCVGGRKWNKIYIYQKYK